MVLMMAPDRAGCDVERDRRGGVQVVARPLIPHPWAAVAGAPEGEVGLGIVVTGHPNRSAAGLPLIASRPGVAAGLAGRRHRVGLPRFLAGFSVVRGDEPADAELAARHADH